MNAEIQNKKYKEIIELLLQMVGALTLICRKSGIRQKINITIGLSNGRLETKNVSIEELILIVFKMYRDVEKEYANKDVVI